MRLIALLIGVPQATLCLILPITLEGKLPGLNWSFSRNLLRLHVLPSPSYVAVDLKIDKPNRGTGTGVVTARPQICIMWMCGSWLMISRGKWIPGSRRTFLIYTCSADEIELGT